jgi:hypothetical protein
MTLVLILGFLFASLRSLSPMARSPVWNAVGINLSITLLVFASFMARFGRGEFTAWWFGFALFGWAQFVLGTALLRYYDDSLMPATHRATLMLARWYWDADASHQFNSLSDITLNPGYGGLLETLYVKANAVMSLLVGAGGGLLAQIVGTACERVRRRAGDRAV